MTAEFLSISQASTRFCKCVQHIHILQKQSGGSFRLDQWSRKLLSSHLKMLFLSATSAASLKTYGGQWKSGPNGGSFQREQAVQTWPTKANRQLLPHLLRIFSIWVRAWSRKSLESSKRAKRWDVLRCETPETSRILKTACFRSPPAVLFGNWYLKRRRFLCSQPRRKRWPSSGQLDQFWGLWGLEMEPIGLVLRQYPCDSSHLAVHPYRRDHDNLTGVLQWRFIVSRGQRMQRIWTAYSIWDIPTDSLKKRKQTTIMSHDGLPPTSNIFKAASLTANGHHCAAAPFHHCRGLPGLHWLFHILRQSTWIAINSQRRLWRHTGRIQQNWTSMYDRIE